MRAFDKIILLIAKVGILGSQNLIFVVSTSLFLASAAEEVARVFLVNLELLKHRSLCLSLRNRHLLDRHFAIIIALSKVLRQQLVLLHLCLPCSKDCEDSTVGILLFHLLLEDFHGVERCLEELYAVEHVCLIFILRFVLSLVGVVQKLLKHFMLCCQLPLVLHVVNYALDMNLTLHSRFEGCENTVHKSQSAPLLDYLERLVMAHSLFVATHPYVEAALNCL